MVENTEINYYIVILCGIFHNMAFSEFELH